jgi:hypothetical protein
LSPAVCSRRRTDSGVHEDAPVALCGGCPRFVPLLAPNGAAQSEAAEAARASAKVHGLSAARQQGYSVKDEDVARIPPLIRGHVAANGTYHFEHPEVPLNS